MFSVAACPNRSWVEKAEAGHPGSDFPMVYRIWTMAFLSGEWDRRDGPAVGWQLGTSHKMLNVGIETGCESGSPDVARF